MIEFAIVAPVLFFLMIGIIEYSMIMFTSSVVEGATANAARLSKTGAEKAQSGGAAAKAKADKERLIKLILKRGSGLLKENRLNVDTTTTTSSSPMGNAGELVEYDVTYRWRVMTFYLRPVLGNEKGEVVISSSTAVVNEPYDE